MSTLLETLPNIDSSSTKMCLENTNNNKNKLIGEIPLSISTFTNLQELSFRNNYLTGEIPICISVLTNLQKLDLSGNKLVGEIPLEISALTNLTKFDIGYNNLSGDIPESISRISSLKYLRLEKNYFNKPSPNWLSSMKNCNLNTHSAFRDIPDSIKTELDKRNIWKTICYEYNWETEDVDIIYIIEDLFSKNEKLSNDMNNLSQLEGYLKLHDKQIYNWNQLYLFVKEKQENTNNLVNTLNFKLGDINEELNKISEKREYLENELELIKQKELYSQKVKQKIECELKIVNYPIDKMDNIVKKTEQITKENEEIDNKLLDILKKSQNLTESISEQDFHILLSKINLTEYYTICIENELHLDVLDVDEGFLASLGMSSRDACCFLYNVDMMKASLFFRNISDGECVICEHNTPIKTIELLQEWNIEFDETIIIKENWIGPYLLYLKRYQSIGINLKKACQYRKKIKQYKKIHENHTSAVEG